MRGFSDLLDGVTIVVPAVEGRSLSIFPPVPILNPGMIFAILCSVMANAAADDLNDVTISSSPQCYSAIFDTAGAVGYFNMELWPDKAKYDYEIDLTDFTNPCVPASDGLMFHIHTNWSNAWGASSNTACSMARGHYDPSLACGPSSDSALTSCTVLSRTSTLGYTYECNKHKFSDLGMQYKCESGDLSGKFGNMYSEVDDGRIEYSGEIEFDPFPPTAVNYNNASGITPQWSSIVLHCPSNNQRILCAGFYPVQCSGDSSSDNEDGLGSGSIAAIVFSLLFVCAVAVGFYFRKRTSGIPLKD